MDDPALTYALLQPSAYPPPVQDVQVIETHISRVFLAGQFAYKVRKPVKFDFVDFSTPQARHADCEAELRLNRRFAPALTSMFCQSSRAERRVPSSSAAGAHHWSTRSGCGGSHSTIYSSTCWAQAAWGRITSMRSPGTSRSFTLRNRVPHTKASALRPVSTPRLQNVWTAWHG
jgi:hypothetical protein